MWDVCTNTSTTGQRKNKQGPRVQAESNGLRMSQNLITLLDLCNNVCLAETVNHDTKTRPRRGETPSNTTRERDGSKLRETLIQNITRLLKRFHGFVSSWSLLNQRTKRCWESRDFTTDAVTTKQPNVHGWAESPKQRVSR